MILKILEDIKNTSGNEQINIIKNNKENELLKNILHDCYNPFLIYKIGSKKLDKVSENCQGEGTLDLTLETYNSFNKYVLQDLIKAKGITDEKLNYVYEFILRYKSEYQSILMGVILKDLRLNIGKSIVNRIWPNLIPDNAIECEDFASFDVMRLVDYKDKKTKKPVEDILPYENNYISRKYDGKNLSITKIKDKIYKLGRSGKLYKKDEYVKIAEEMDKYFNLDEYVYLGEVVYLYDDEVNSLSKTCKENDDELYYILFGRIPKKIFFNKEKYPIKDMVNGLIDDYITVFGDGNREVKYSSDYMSIINDKSPKIRFASQFGVHGDNVEEYKRMVNCVYGNQWEGLVILNKDGYYTYGTTGKKEKMAYRFKPRYDNEFEIIGFLEGEGKYVNNLGNIVIKIHENDKDYFVKVGTGYTDKMRSFIWKHKNDILNDTNIQAKVSYLKVSTDNKKGTISLIQPAFEGFRTKDKEDIDIEKYFDKEF